MIPMYDFSKLFKKPLNDQGPLGQKPKPDVVEKPRWNGTRPPPGAEYQDTMNSWSEAMGTNNGADNAEPERPYNPDLPFSWNKKGPETTGGRGTGRFMSQDMWEEKFPDRPYMTDEEGYEIDSRSDAGGPRRGLTPKKSTTLSANEKKRQAALEGASNSPMQNSASMSGSQRRGITAKKTLLTRARAGAN